MTRCGLKMSNAIPDSTKLRWKIAWKRHHHGDSDRAYRRGFAWANQGIGGRMRYWMFVSINGQHVEYKGKKINFISIVANWCGESYSNFSKKSSELCICSAVGFMGVALMMICNTVGALNLPFVIEPNYFKNNEVYQMLGFSQFTKDKTILPVLPDSLRSIRWHTSGLNHWKTRF